MAFDKTNPQFTDSLKASLTTQSHIRGIYEKKKNYQFMLKPSNREKLRQLSKEAGVRSDSAYLDELLESL